MVKKLLIFVLAFFTLPIMAQDELVVEVSEAGSLGKLLTERGLSSASNLTVKGQINSADIRTLRHLCGGHDENPEATNEEYTSTLRVLNLENADIVAGGGNYYYDKFVEISHNRYTAVEGEIGWYMFANTSSLEEVILPKSVKQIWSAAFYKSGVKKVVIGENTQKVGMYAFADCFNLEQVTSLSSAPPVLVDEAGDMPDMSSCELVVPNGSADAYLAADFWKGFKVVHEVSSIGESPLSQSSTVEAVYSISGVRSTSGLRGIKIVKLSDGRVVKTIE